MRTSSKIHLLTIAGAVASTLAGSTALADSLTGRWDATMTINGVVIPFRLDISGVGSNLRGTLYNGDEKETTTSALLDHGTVVLKFEHYLTTIVATPKDGQLDGKVDGRLGDRQVYIGSYAFHASRHNSSLPAASGDRAPTIGGSWEIPHESSKGEKAWRLVVKQSGSEVSAAILRVDGDTGALTGTWRDDRFVLSHFDGSRPALMEIMPERDGTLVIRQRTGTRDDKFVAYRAEVARAKGLPAPANYTTHTSMRDPNEVFTFSFPDINGKIVSNDDPRFKDKVLLAIVTGTWCPNCHDEAQYLVQLYKQYRERGLEIVALDFEEPEQRDELARARAFVKRYGIEYTYLIAGAPSELSDKIPQAVNLNTWPATFFVGRDGKVKGIHAGFAAPASGDFNRQLKEEFTSTIERLLAQPLRTSHPPLE
jgi:peroxiredoxin